MEYQDQSAYKKWLHSYGHRYWYLILAAFILSTVAILLALANPLPIKFLADSVFGSSPVPNFLGLNADNKHSLLLAAVVAFFAIGFVKGVFTLFQSLIIRRMHQVVDRRSMDEAFSAISSIPYNHPDRKDNGAYLYQITNQSQQISTYFLTDLITIIQSVLMIGGILVILSTIDLWVTLITFATIPLLMGSVVIFGRILLKKANETELAHSEIYNIVNETLGKLRTIQAFAKENIRLDILNKAVRFRNKKANSQLLSAGVFSLSNETIILLSSAIALIVGGNRALAGAITFGDLLLFIAYMNILFDPLVGMVASIGSMKESSAGLRQVHGSLQNAGLLHLSSGTLKDVSIRGDVAFQNVTYRVGDKPVLEDINLTLPAGSITAFVGPSGAGKSTLFNLLLRFATPDKGWVKIDGHDIVEYDLAFLREHIALVEQEPDIFNLSFKDNIALASPNTPNNLPDVMGAAYIGNVAGVVEAETEKYEQLVDNNKLSGGQKQRLAMARAVYKRAPIILLDEPTSALDKKAAEILENNLLQYLKGKTVLLITHELSLLEKIPNIYVVQDKAVCPISDFGGLEKYRQNLHVPQKTPS